MKNKMTIDTSILTSMNGSCMIGSNTISASRIYPDRIAIEELRKVLFPEKKVIPEKPKTIDQMVASALSRLHVSINAEADWASLQIKKDFRSIRNKYISNRCYRRRNRRIVSISSFYIK
jgi:hypothetical protein